MRRFRLDRRTFLRGMLGGAAASIALPPLECMFNESGTAYAQGMEIPKRFGIFFWGNGVIPNRWNPPTQGANYELSEQLQPLAGVKEYVSVVSGCRIKTGNERGHHAGTVGILSASPMIPQDPMGAPYASTFSAPSIDQVIASRIGDQTRFRSLEFGVLPRVTTGEGTTLRYLSHNGPDNANPPEYNPAVMFDRLFGEGFVEPGEQENDDPRLILRQNILDAVRADTAKLRARLGAADRIRLEQHLESVRALQNQIRVVQDTPIPSMCVAPGRPGDIGDASTSEQQMRSRVMADLIVMSMVCDMSRVWTNMFDGSVGGNVFWNVDSSTTWHSLTHDEPGDQPKVNQVVQWIMGELAYLLTRLRDTPEGDGNMLDHHAILCSSDTSLGRDHTIHDYPILVAGRAGGALTGNVHYRSITDENTSHTLLSMIRAMGIDMAEFGNGGGRVDSGLSAIEA